VKTPHLNLVPVPAIVKQAVAGSQAERVFDRFGGPKRLCGALAAVGHPRNLATLYRWAYPKPKGCGGVIPSSAWPIVMAAARFEGVVLPPDVTSPYRITPEEV
jgi:hypothetical protein